jgi:transcriptional regulator with XRE-family HTH domain
MTLKDYLAQEGNTATKLADETGVSVSTITRAAEGTTMPSRGLMNEIFKATGGLVTPNDFFGIAA